MGVALSCGRIFDCGTISPVFPSFLGQMTVSCFFAVFPVCALLGCIVSSAALSVHTKPASSCLNELVVPHLSQPCKIRLPHSRRHFSPMNGGGVELWANIFLWVGCHEHLHKQKQISRLTRNVVNW